METYKIQKYLTKLSSESFESENFKLYLNKINYWYNQYGCCKKKNLGNISASKRVPSYGIQYKK